MFLTKSFKIGFLSLGIFAGLLSSSSVLSETIKTSDKQLPISNNSFSNELNLNTCVYDSKQSENFKNITIAQSTNPNLNICYDLYVQCTDRNPPSVPCDDCLRICLNNNGEWPFSKCSIPPR